MITFVCSEWITGLLGIPNQARWHLKKRPHTIDSHCEELFRKYLYSALLRLITMSIILLPPPSYKENRIFYQFQYLLNWYSTKDVCGVAKVERIISIFNVAVVIIVLTLLFTANNLDFLRDSGRKKAHIDALLNWIGGKIVIHCSFVISKNKV